MNYKVNESKSNNNNHFLSKKKSFVTKTMNKQLQNNTNKKNNNTLFRRMSIKKTQTVQHFYPNSQKLQFKNYFSGLKETEQQI